MLHVNIEIFNHLACAPRFGPVAPASDEKMEIKGSYRSVSLNVSSSELPSTVINIRNPFGLVFIQRVSAKYTFTKDEGM